MLSVKIYPDKFQNESFFLPAMKPITDMRLSFYIKPEEFDYATHAASKKHTIFVTSLFFKHPFQNVFRSTPATS